MKKYYIGIDIGGTYTRAVALNDLQKQKVEFLKITTPQNRKDLENALLELIKKVNPRREKIMGIGVAVAGVVNRKRGTVEVAEHLRFLEGWNPVLFFKKKFQRPVLLENDSQCFVLAETLWGVARNKKNVLGVAIGTGIGGGILIDGKLYHGAHGSAGEVGDILVDKDKTFEQSAAKHAYEKEGDRSEHIGRALASLVSVLDPEMIVLGGGAVASRKINLEVVREAFQKQYMIDIKIGKIAIVFGKLGDAAQAIGAALLFKEG